MINQVLVLLALVAVSADQLPIPAPSLIVAPPITVKSKQAGINITTTKVSRIVGDVDPMGMFTFLIDSMNTAEQPGARVVVIESRGGYVEVGEDIIKAIEAEKATGTKVVCVVKGEASSMAFNILTHCSVRLATKESTSLVHKIRGAFQGVYTPKQLREIAAELEAAEEPYRQANAKAMRLTIKQYDLFADQETIWTAQQLLDRGYLHGLVDEN